jgi:hypothetical protein
LWVSVGEGADEDGVLVEEGDAGGDADQPGDEAGAEVAQARGAFGDVTEEDDGGPGGGPVAEEEEKALVIFDEVGGSEDGDDGAYEAGEEGGLPLF